MAGRDRRPLPQLLSLTLETKIPDTLVTANQPASEPASASVEGQKM